LEKTVHIPEGVDYFHEAGVGYYFYHKSYAKGLHPFLFLTEAPKDFYAIIQEKLNKITAP
jgi:hypothetical protein